MVSVRSYTAVASFGYIVALCAAARGSGKPPAVGRPDLDLHLGLPDNFLSEIMERQWVHVRAPPIETDRFQHLWSSRQAVRASESKFRAVSSGVEHPWMYKNDAELSTGSRIDDAKLAWKLNMTLVHDGVETQHTPLAKYLFHATAFFGLRVRANSYMTPPGNVQGFQFHTDSHDTLILQIEGNKDWEICDVHHRAKPLSKQEWWFLYLSAYPDNDPLIQNCTVITLQEGDVLYMPQDQIHRAMTGSKLSLHVTVGVYREEYTMKQTLLTILERTAACPSESALQKLSDWISTVVADEHPEMLQVPPALNCKGSVGSGCGFYDNRFLRKPLSKLYGKTTHSIPNMPAIPNSVLNKLSAQLKTAVGKLANHPTANDKGVMGVAPHTPASILRALAAQNLGPRICGHILDYWRENIMNHAIHDLKLGTGNKRLDRKAPVTWVDDDEPLMSSELDDAKKWLAKLKNFERTTRQREINEVKKERKKKVRTVSGAVYACIKGLSH
jgi:hypothetical protein